MVAVCVRKKAEQGAGMRMQMFKEVLKGQYDEVSKMGLGQTERNEDRNSLTTLGRNFSGRGTSKHKHLSRPVCWSEGCGEGCGNRKVFSVFPSRRIEPAHRPLSETRSHATLPGSPRHLCITSGQGVETALVGPGAGRQLSPPCEITMFRFGR